MDVSHALLSSIQQPSRDSPTAALALADMVVAATE
jgi:hypothetical protein